MARIRGRDTRPEVLVRDACAAAGWFGVAHVPVLGVRPDLVFEAARVVVFVDGCFWHGCPQHYSAPSTRPAYWQERLRRNVERDRRQTLTLETAGWRVVRVWEHEAEGPLAEVARRICDVITRPEEPRTDWRVVGVVQPSRQGGRPRRRLEDLREAWRQRVEEG